LSLVPGATLISLAPELFTIFLLAACWWVLSVKNLSNEFEKKRKATTN
jgi:ATP/ADP translocase